MLFKVRVHLLECITKYLNIHFDFLKFLNICEFAYFSDGLLADTARFLGQWIEIF